MVMIMVMMRQIIIAETQSVFKLVLPSGPGDSRAEFGPSRERSKQLTRVPTGGTATRSFTPELQWRRVDRTDAVERVHMSATQKRKHSLRDAETETRSRCANGNTVYVMTSSYTAKGKNTMTT